MTRPTPRKSSLSGSSPITSLPAEPKAVTPASSTQEPVSEVDQDAPTRKTRAPEAQAQEAGRRPQPRRKYPPKVSFYQDREDTDRVRGAILHTMATEGTRSLSQFINQAVMAEVERLERKYNGGQPFPAVGARELPQGRPMGEVTTREDRP